MKLEQLFSVKNKIVLITGGSRGIGEMIAEGFIANGAKVYISSRKEVEIKETARRLKKTYGGFCEAIPCDISKIGGVEKLALEFKKKETHLDVLINNAGAVWGEPLEKFSEIGWDKVMDLNVKSIFFMTQKFLALLKVNAQPDSKSRIINIGSIDGINTPYYENYSYSVAKAAVHKLTKVLAARLISDNIICNAIAPGPFPSKMLGSAVKHDYTIISKKNPSNRVGRSTDIAGIALFLASQASEFTVGEVISCDGGLVASAGHDLTND
ncbi:MAG: Rhamnolipids biosynthesis 3-oxoacyl-[acyl-carrier-protein] reductase [Alphaproteobacteria bacterium MarineAlpha9_Bin4]|nr:3-oxoacyl-ACP reductase [Pelagibacterales bacterium]PPR27516.1 MAG: Rhamnolipids biosynthesis 3-oxoacyl-[acyl-carrier-protein] reductase [Alphaproteobacteria bacterium MarineAlpha9_Bin4]|tara:strand:+ start:257 stop:1060 length:804 start_codon:yes stop_codon:yes gene_type:complete